MYLLNINNGSKTLVFKEFKCFPYKYYLKFVKTFKKHPNKFDIKQLLVLLYDGVESVKNYYSIDRILKYNNVSQVGTGKNPTTPLYSETKKVKYQNILLKVLQVLMLKF